MTTPLDRNSEYPASVANELVTGSPVALVVLIYDSAEEADSLRKCCPESGASRMGMTHIACSGTGNHYTDKVKPEK
jgi:hypothetical protein